MDISNRIKERMQALNLRAVDVSRATAASKGTVSQWLSGIASPGGKNIIKVAKVLQCRPEWLIDGKGLYCLDNEHQNISTGPDIHGYYPLLDWVQAGDWTCINAVQPFDAEHFPCLVPCSRRTFALKVRGESMHPKFEENELIFVDPEVEATNGKYVVVMMDDENEATFKQLIIEGNKKYLKAANPDWPKKILEINGNCTIVGVVISATRFL